MNSSPWLAAFSPSIRSHSIPCILFKWNCKITWSESVISRLHCELTVSDFHETNLLQTLAWSHWLAKFEMSGLNFKDCLSFNEVIDMKHMFHAEDQISSWFFDFLTVKGVKGNINVSLHANTAGVTCRWQVQSHVQPEGAAKLALSASVKRNTM